MNTIAALTSNSGMSREIGVVVFVDDIAAGRSVPEISVV